MSRRPPLAVAGASAVSAFGLGWKGLGEAILAGAIAPSTSTALAASHPGVPAFEVPPIPAEEDAGDGRVRKSMSRPARLAAIALRRALADAGWAEGREEIGAWLGVGSSNGPVGEMLAMLRASLDGGEVSMARLGAEGLLASNPLFTFHVLNNFTLCHGAILEGLQGPNAAFFSRGAGTVAALGEALATLAEGDCDRALAGGADSALHPVTWSELVRDGFAGAGLVAGEGAAMLALASACDAPLCFVERAEVIPARRRPLEGALAAALGPEERAAVDLAVLAPWGGRAREQLVRFAGEALPGARIADVTRSLGEAPGATAALAWVAAVDLLSAGRARRAAILSAGVDGDLGVVLMSREARP